jgi:hypothetical protein
VVAPPRANLPLLAFAQKVEQKVTNNSNLPGIAAVLTALSTAVTAFDTALTNKVTEKDLANSCTAARQSVCDNLSHVKDFVNSIAEKASPDQAMAIIESAGLRARKTVVRTKSPLKIKYGGLSGSVLLVASGAGRGAVYYFQVSTDQKSWTALPNVMKCKTSATGLTVGTTYYFRVQTQTSKGLTDWTTVESFVVR